MSRHPRESKAELRAWVAPEFVEVVRSRAANQGVDKWMIVEDLLAKGLRSEGVEIASVQPVSESARAEAFTTAHACVIVPFKGDADRFMRAISALRGERKLLTIRDWREWKKNKAVPAKYVQDVLTIDKVTEWMGKAREDAALAELNRQ